MIDRKIIVTLLNTIVSNESKNEVWKSGNLIITSHCANVNYCFFFFQNSLLDFVKAMDNGQITPTTANVQFSTFSVIPRRIRIENMKITHFLYTWSATAYHSLLYWSPAQHSSILSMYNLRTYQLIYRKKGRDFKEIYF